MREQLIQYVNLLFAGVGDGEDMKQEILQNTLDRFDDLISQGKSPEAAYRLAIAGIGDISELLGSAPEEVTKAKPIQQPVREADDPQHRKYRAIAIAMYILCPIPLIILDEFGLDTLGFCLTLALVAAATYVLFLYKKEDAAEEPPAPEDPLKKSIGSVIWAVATVIYFLVSFTTNYWHITWLLFPIAGSVQGLVNAILDLKEACRHEN